MFKVAKYDYKWGMYTYFRARLLIIVTSRVLTQQHTYKNTQMNTYIFIDVAMHFVCFVVKHVARRNHNSWDFLHKDTGSTPKNAQRQITRFQANRSCQTEIIENFCYFVFVISRILRYCLYKC